MTINASQFSALLPKYDRWSVGYEPLFHRLSDAAPTEKVTYPPYNITQFDDTYVIELAVAGFRSDEIDITVKDRTLTVASDTSAIDETPGQKGKELHKGIARRSFKLNFALAEHIEVQEAKLEDGILTITLEQEIPEELKPKVIPITG